MIAIDAASLIIGMGIGWLVMGLWSWYCMDKLVKRIQEDQAKAIKQDFAKYDPENIKVTLRIKEK